MFNLSRYSVGMVVGALLLIGAGVLILSFPAHSVSAESGNGSIARGAGTTIIQGGTGSPDFVPVLTTVAFHAERSGNSVSGDFECLARAPLSSTGAGSAQFRVNVMYVTGQVTGAVVSGDVATLTGTAHITGIGAGTGVPFRFVVHGGGPGAPAVLTTGSLVFNEILTEGSFQVSGTD